MHSTKHSTNSQCKLADRDIYIYIISQFHRFCNNRCDILCCKMVVFWWAALREQDKAKLNAFGIQQMLQMLSEKWSWVKIAPVLHQIETLSWPLLQRTGWRIGRYSFMLKRKGALRSVSLTLPDVTYDLDAVFDHQCSLNARANLLSCLLMYLKLYRKCQMSIYWKILLEGIYGSLVIKRIKETICRKTSRLIQHT